MDVAHHDGPLHVESVSCHEFRPLAVLRMSARIDAHQHFWRYSAASHGWIDDSMAVLKRDFLPEALEPLLLARGYQGCVAVQAQLNVEETRWLLELAERHAFIRG